MVAVTNGFEFTIENEEEFGRLLDKYKKDLSDFSIPFRLMSSSWFRRNKRIFLLTSEGKYAPLGGFNPNAPSGYRSQSRRKRAETLKERKTGRDWAPILLGVKGAIRDAATGGAGSVLSIGKRALVMGVDDAAVPYAKYHNSDKGPRKVLPKRKFIFLSGGKDKAKDAVVGNDIKTFTVILEDHVEQVLSGKVI